MRATPMLEQYWALKREAGDALLLYRLGDFYEMFFEDAAYAAPLLGLVLTARHKDGDGAAVSTLDLSTGDFAVVKLPDRAALTEWLLRRVPRELVVFPSDRTAAELLVASLASSGAEAPALSPLRDDSPRGAGAVDLLKRHFRTATLEPFGLTGAGAATDAAAALLSYARATQHADCDHVRSLRSEAPDDGLVVDAVTAGHLELFRSARDGGPKGTVFSLLDRTGTSFGARALRRLLERPLGRRAGIEARLDGVEELQEDAARLESLASAFREIPDLPRLLARLAVGAGSPRDLVALGHNPPRDRLAQGERHTLGRRFAARREDRRARRAEMRAKAARTHEAVAERHQVARRAGADREAREQAWEIGNLAERRGEALEARRVLLELLDAVEPRFDAGAAAERPFEEPAEGTRPE